jgi:cleavage and polyadenylation specificity factor subunit 1
LQQFGRDQLGLEVIAADFLPDGNSLFIVAANGDGDFHILQFDPESPESERGAKLLHRSTFSSGSFVLTMTLLPQNIPSSTTAVSDDGKGSTNGITHTDHGSDTNSNRQILVTSQEGSVGLITSLPEQTYRRLLALQNILSANIEHACGLNPRAYRAVETDGVGGASMIDGNLVQRWLDQDRFHQASTADKVGSTVWEIRDDLNQIGMNGLPDL